MIMKPKTNHKTHMPIILVGGAIPTVLILSSYYRLPEAVTIMLVTFLSLILGSIALWAYANRQADGSEWWQDDSASGWRGY